MKTLKSVLKEAITQGAIDKILLPYRNIEQSAPTNAQQYIKKLKSALVQAAQSSRLSAQELDQVFSAEEPATEPSATSGQSVAAPPAPSAAAPTSKEPVSVPTDPSEPSQQELTPKEPPSSVLPPADDSTYRGLFGAPQQTQGVSDTRFDPGVYQARHSTPPPLSLKSLSKGPVYWDKPPKNLPPEPSSTQTTPGASAAKKYLSKQQPSLKFDPSYLPKMKDLFRKI